jgi:hypothetical protein
MDLDELERRLAAPLERLRRLDAACLLPAPVDLRALLERGFAVRDTLVGPDLALADPLVVTGAAEVGRLRLAAPLVVLGDLRADELELADSLLVLGRLDAGALTGVGEPHVVTVFGPVDLGRVALRRQYAAQFLGGGRVDELADEDDGGDDLLGLLERAGSRLVVGATARLDP